MSDRSSMSPEERLVESRRPRSSSEVAVRIDDLAIEFGVSEMTIRRDLDELEALGRRAGFGVAPLPLGLSRSSSGTGTTPRRKPASPRSSSR